MRLDELAKISTGLVVARKRSNGLNDLSLSYKALNLKAINEKGYIVDSLIDDFEANEKIKPVYLTQLRDIIVRLTAPFTAVLIDEIHTGLIIPSHFVVIRVNPKMILPEYLYWLLNTEKVKQKLQQNVNSLMTGSVKPMSYAALDIEMVTLDKQRLISNIYILSKKEQMLSEQLMKQRVLYYTTAIDKIQKEMRKCNEDNKE